MKVVLFCGGLGTRLREHSDTIPKPLVNVGIPADPVAPDALLRALRPQGLRALPRLPRRPDPRVLPQLRRGMSNDFTLSKGGKRSRAARAATSTTGVSRSSTPGCTPTSGSACCACATTSRTRSEFLANYSDGLSDLPLDQYIEDFMRRDRGRKPRFGAPVGRAFMPCTAHADGNVTSVQASATRLLDQRRVLLPAGRHLRLHPRGRGAGRAAVRAPDRKKRLLARTDYSRLLAGDGHVQGQDPLRSHGSPRRLPVDGVAASASHGAGREVRITNLIAACFD